MKTFFLFSFLCMLLFASATFADSTGVILNPWKLQFETSLGLTQASFSDNWQGGEAGSIIWVAGFNGKAEKQLSPALFWGNELKLAFGQSHTQDKDTKQWKVPQKASDKIRYDGLLRLTKGWAVDPYASFVFESQFLDARSPKTKRYVNPIDLTEGLGVARDIFKVENVRRLTTRIGFGFRQHLETMDDPTDTTFTRSKSISTNDGGVEWVTDYQVGSAKTKVSFDSKLTIFQALFYSKANELKGTPQANYWKTADINWDNTFRANLTAVLQMSLGWQLLYDKQISKAGQFKETLTLGMAYKFANFSDKK